MSNSPVLANTNWRFLLREITAKPAFRALASLPAVELQLALVMPASIALAIEHFFPQLKNRTHLNIVIAGAEWGPDAVDDGRWYQMLPTLLGMPELAVTVTLVGPNVGRTTRTGGENASTTRCLSVSSSFSAKWAKPETYAGTLGEYLEHHDIGGVNLLVLSHPGLERYATEWLESCELDNYLMDDVPVAVFSYDRPEAEHDAYILDVYGYKASPTIVTNPFSLVRSDSSRPSGSCSAIWSLWPVYPPAGFEPDEARVAALADFVERVPHLFLDEGMYPGVRFPGDLVRHHEFGTLTRGMHGWFFCEKTGKVFLEDDDAVLQELEGYRLHEVLRESAPTPDSLAFARTLWAIAASKELSEAMEE